MGRITIFTREDCFFCLRAKRELQYRCLPFVEISIDTFPERREEMMELSGRMTVPQIFLNDKFLGGSDELSSLLELWDAAFEEQPTVAAVSPTSSTSSVISIDNILKNSRIWRRYQQEVASLPDPTDPRLALPETGKQLHSEQTKPYTVGVTMADMDESSGELNFGCIPLPDGSCGSLREVTNELIEHMPRHKLAYLARFYTDCFPGDKGVDALLQIYPFKREGESDENARQKAVNFGQLLQQYGILHHVCNERTFQDTKDFYYRLQPFHEPNVLNSFQSLQRVLEHLPDDRSLPSCFSKLSKDAAQLGRSLSVDSDGNKEVNIANDTLRDLSGNLTGPPIVTPEGALKLLTKLQKLLSRIEARATSRDGIDFLLAKDYDDPDFQQLEEGSCQLQCMDPAALAMTMTDAEKTVFGIHLYNIMVRHAYIKVGIPMKSSQRGAFFTGVCYKIANQILSLDDVEHGILRANTRHPYHVKSQFVGDDPRKAWAVSKLDPRIHFVLFCGANSCPPIGTYTVENLDQEMGLAAQSFVQEDSNVLLDEATNTVHLSMIFKWYRNDFGASSNKEILNVILNYLPKGAEKYRKLARMVQRKTGSTGSLLSSNSSKDVVKVKFLTYDWGSKAAPGKCLEFRSSLLRTRETSLKAPFSKSRPAAFTGGGCISAK